MEVSGHTAAVGHTWALGNAQDHWDTDVDLVHGVCILCHLSWEWEGQCYSTGNVGTLSVDRGGRWSFVRVGSLSLIRGGGGALLSLWRIFIVFVVHYITIKQTLYYLCQKFTIQVYCMTSQAVKHICSVTASSNCHKLRCKNANSVGFNKCICNSNINSNNLQSNKSTYDPSSILYMNLFDKGNKMRRSRAKLGASFVYSDELY